MAVEVIRSIRSSGLKGRCCTPDRQVGVCEWRIFGHAERPPKPLDPTPRAARRADVNQVSDGFATQREEIERALSDLCTEYREFFPGTIASAIEYGALGKGKRMRPLLALFTYQACGGKKDATRLVCASEIIHSYSLMHDDLPCMDDDDMRRGRPTAHKVYGSRTAIAAGAAMIPLAVAIARDALADLNVDRERTRRTVAALLEGAGAGGMIGGQLRDLAGEGGALTLDELETVHSAKTGALITASARMGAIAAGADDESVAAVDRYGRWIGLAFQIMDDVLDQTSTTVALGKTAGRDEELRKSTYPALLGLAGARARADALVGDALGALSERGLLTHDLQQVANFMVTRTF
jgi:geranylgeranyl diphosphate synthase type II